MEREKAILIDVVQQSDDITAAEKDELRDYLNATYVAANGSEDRLRDLTRANMLGARITVRTQTQLGRIVATVERIAKQIEEAPVEQKKTGKFAMFIELAKILRVPVTIVLVVLLFVLVIKPELAVLVQAIMEK